MAGHKRIRKVSHTALAQELRVELANATGPISQAEEGEKPGLLPALHALGEAAACVEEAARRWEMARSKIRTMLKLTARARAVSGRARWPALDAIDARVKRFLCDC